MLIIHPMSSAPPTNPQIIMETTKLQDEDVFQDEQVAKEEENEQNKKYRRSVIFSFLFMMAIALLLVLDLLLAPIHQADLESLTVNLEERRPQVDADLRFHYGSRLSSVQPLSATCHFGSGDVTLDFAKQCHTLHLYSMQATCPDQDVESHASMIWELLFQDNEKTTLAKSLLENATCDMTFRVHLGHVLPYKYSTTMEVSKLIEKGTERVNKEDDELHEYKYPPTQRRPLHICHLDSTNMELCLPLDLPSHILVQMPSVVRLELPELEIQVQPSTSNNGMIITMNAAEAIFDPNASVDGTVDGSEPFLFDEDTTNHNVAVFSFESKDDDLPFYRPVLDLVLTSAQAPTTTIVVAIDGQGSFLEILLGGDHTFTLELYQDKTGNVMSSIVKQRRHLLPATTATRHLEPVGYAKAYQDAAAHCMSLSDSGDAFNFGLCWLLELDPSQLTIVGNMTMYEEHGVSGIVEMLYNTGQEKYFELDIAALIHILKEDDLMDIIGKLIMDWQDESNLLVDMAMKNIGSLWPFDGKVLTTGSLDSDAAVLDMIIENATFLWEDNVNGAINGIDSALGKFLFDWEEDLELVFEVDHDVSDRIDARLTIGATPTTDIIDAAAGIIIEQEEGFEIIGTTACFWDGGDIWNAEASLILEPGEETGMMRAGIREDVSGTDMSLSGSSERQDSGDVFVKGELKGKDNDIITLDIEYLYNEAEDFIMTLANDWDWKDKLWEWRMTMSVDSEEDKANANGGLSTFGHVDMGITETADLDFGFSMTAVTEAEDSGDLHLDAEMDYKRSDATKDDSLTMQVDILLNEVANFVMTVQSALFRKSEDVWDAAVTLVVDSDEIEDKSSLTLDVVDRHNLFTLEVDTAVERNLDGDLFLNTTIVHSAVDALEDDVVDFNVSIRYIEDDPKRTLRLVTNTTAYWGGEDKWDVAMEFADTADSTDSTGKITIMISEEVSEFIWSTLLLYELKNQLEQTIFELQTFVIQAGLTVYADSSGALTIDPNAKTALLDLQDQGRIDFVLDIDTSWYRVGANIDRVYLTSSSDPAEIFLDGTASFDATAEATTFRMLFDMPEIKYTLDTEIGYILDREMNEFEEIEKGSFTLQIGKIHYYWQDESYIDLTSRMVVAFGQGGTSLELSASDSADFDVAGNFTIVFFSDVNTATATVERFLLRAQSDTYLDAFMSLGTEDSITGDSMLNFFSDTTDESQLQIDTDMTISWFDADQALHMSVDHMALGWKERMYVEMPLDVLTSELAPSPSRAPVASPAPTQEATVKAVDGQGPSSPPTEEGDEMFTFLGIEMRCEGCPALTPELEIAFKQSLEAFYDDLYQPKISRRNAGNDVVVTTAFDTTVTVTGDNPDATGNTITYDQTVTYNTASGYDEEEARDLLVSPFETNTTAAEFITILAKQDEDFANVTAIDAPSVPAAAETTPGASGDDAPNVKDDDEEVPREESGSSRRSTRLINAIQIVASLVGALIFFVG